MNFADVLNGRSTCSVEQADCIAWFDSMPAGCLDLVFGSPPYCDARTYGIDAVYDCISWVEWMLKVTQAAQRACKGPVFWVAAGVQRDRNYWPACEGLMWEWWKLGGDCQLYRPCCWWKVDADEGGTGIPGSGGEDYLRADWEYIMCFKRPGILLGSNNTAMGHPPVYNRAGGEMSNRTADGRRINEQVGEGAKAGRDPWDKHGRGNNLGGRNRDGSVKKGTNRRKNGSRKVDAEQLMDATAGHDADGNTGRADGRPMPKIANPGNVIKARVGGGHMGSKLCHENEAPFPEKLPEFFIRSFSPENGIVGDCFSGSGTTGKVALQWGRRFVGCDLRQSQVDLSTRRFAEASTLFDNPEATP